jgi:hypothetical protein
MDGQKARGGAMVKVVEVQGTPNPDALKFITDARLVERGAKSFEDPRAAKDDALGKALFASGPVASVFLLDRFVTVTKVPGSEWPAMEYDIRAVIETQAQDGIQHRAHTRIKF